MFLNREREPAFEQKGNPRKGVSFPGVSQRLKILNGGLNGYNPYNILNIYCHNVIC
jgi:hypothetical protein